MAHSGSEARFAEVRDIIEVCCKREAQALARFAGAAAPEAADLLGDAWLGVVAAERCWKPESGASFRTFAGLKIHWAIANVKRAYGAERGMNERRHPRSFEARRTVASALRLDAAPGNGLGDPLVQLIADGGAMSPVDAAEVRDIAEVALNALAPRLRRLAEGYYIRGETLAEWALAEGISESRASHLLRRLLARLAAMRGALSVDD